MDLTMCDDKKCPWRLQCKRFTSIPDPQWQSYFMKSPLIDRNGKCDMFMKK